MNRPFDWHAFWGVVAICVAIMGFFGGFMGFVSVDYHTSIWKWASYMTVCAVLVVGGLAVATGLGM